ncbi:MAG TPA: DNA gyrase C-terminal beta-propeller domain-containing protein, partial [Thermoanaerobaculia bacterium]|nr:DNA gyrase C-terminal beta-propeller domain-containing protein [Thermoanaerobaculia bacterium]
IEDMIADEPMVITVTQAGYVKRSPLSLYRAQHRGGKGRTGMVTKEDDFVEHLYVANAHSYILVFTQSGRVHWLKVHEIPEAGPAARGKAIVNLLNLEANERLATTVAVREFLDDRYLMFATQKGTVKKTALSAYSNPRVGGIIGIFIDEGDKLLSVRETDGQKDILLATAKGFSIRFPEKTVRSMGRATYGVKGIELRPGDLVIGMEELDTNCQILTVTERGYGKRTPVEDYRLQNRGGLGIINLKVSQKTGEVVGVKSVSLDSGLMLITQDGMIIRLNVSGVREVGRSTQGVRLMNLDAEDQIVAVAKLAEKDEETEIELAKSEGGDGPMAAELELEATDEPEEMGGVVDAADLGFGEEPEEEPEDEGPETIH